MVQLLVLGNVIVWGTVYALKKLDKYWAPNFDPDLDRYAGDPTDWDIKATIIDFKKELEHVPNEYLELDDLIPYEPYYPNEIWCNGKQYRVCNKEDMKLWMQDKNLRMLKQEWNGIPFPEGEELMYIDWFRMKGYSNEAAEMLVAQNVRPWLERDLC